MDQETTYPPGLSHDLHSTVCGEFGCVRDRGFYTHIIGLEYSQSFLTADFMAGQTAPDSRLLLSNEEGILSLAGKVLSSACDAPCAGRMFLTLTLSFKILGCTGHHGQIPANTAEYHVASDADSPFML